MKNGEERENTYIVPEDTDLRTFFTTIRIVGILIISYRTIHDCLHDFCLRLYRQVSGFSAARL